MWDPPIFARNVPGMTERLQRAVVAIAGCGGLGSNAAVMLTRAGVGQLILADHDRVEWENLNRQHFFAADVGRPKVAALAQHLLAINPKVNLTLHELRLEPDTVDTLFGEARLLIEAFDDAAAKQWLVESWCTAYPERPVVSASGLAGFGRTEALQVRHAGNIHYCGDGFSDAAVGLCSARVQLVAAMQANVAIALLMSEGDAA